VERGTCASLPCLEDGAWREHLRRQGLCTYATVRGGILRANRRRTGDLHYFWRFSPFRDLRLKGRVCLGGAVHYTAAAVPSATSASSRCVMPVSAGALRFMPFSRSCFAFTALPLLRHNVIHSRRIPLRAMTLAHISALRTLYLPRLNVVAGPSILFLIRFACSDTSARYSSCACFCPANATIQQLGPRGRLLTL